jgi:hypothetical protein
VKLHHLADTGRVLEVRTSKGDLRTPTRGLMHTEFSKFRSLSEFMPRNSWSIDALPNPLQEVVLDYNNDNLDGLANSNGYYKRQISRIRRAIPSGAKRLTLSFFQMKSGTRALTDQDIVSLVDLQIDSGRLDLISIPDPNIISTDANPLRRALEKANVRLKQLREDQARIVPYLDMNTDPPALRERLDLIKDDYNMIGFRYRRVRPSRRVIREVMAEKDTMIHVSGAWKHYSNDMRIVPEMHILPVDCVDSVCAYKKPGFPRPPAASKPDTVFAEPDSRTVDAVTMQLRSAIQTSRSPAEKEYFFEPVALGYYTRSEHNDEFSGVIGCDCPLCTDKAIDEFYHEYYRNDGKSDIRKLRVHLCVHELFASYHEFANAQTEIETNSYKEYLESKPAIVNNINAIQELSPTLEDYF